VYFQALDDKKECVGIYHDGRLVFDESEFPETFSNMRTWRYSGFLRMMSRLNMGGLWPRENTKRMLPRTSYV
jgi:hypothetical protein